MDSRDTRADIHGVHDQPWSVNGPNRVPQKDIVIFEILSGYFYLFFENTLYKPSKHYGILFWSFLYFIKAQGTLANP